MRTKYSDSPEKMEKYITLMTAYGVTSGIAFKFHGQVANTLHAHRVIQHYQSTSSPAVAGLIIDALYRKYFEEERHPSEEDVLVEACVEAGVDEGEARSFVRGGEGEDVVRELVREQARDGVDSVPWVSVEGKRRDVGVVGAKEVGEYVKVLKQVVKESG